MYIDYLMRSHLSCYSHCQSSCQEFLTLRNSKVLHIQCNQSSFVNTYPRAIVLDTFLLLCTMYINLILTQTNTFISLSPTLLYRPCSVIRMDFLSHTHPMHHMLHSTHCHRSNHVSRTFSQLFAGQNLLWRETRRDSAVARYQDCLLAKRLRDNQLL